MAKKINKENNVIEINFKQQESEKLEFGHYLINYDKIKTVEDIVTIMRRFDIAFYLNKANIGEISHLLKEINLEDIINLDDDE